MSEPDESPDALIRARLKAERERRHQSRQAVAERLGLSGESVRLIEDAERKMMPKLDRYAQYAEAFGLELHVDIVAAGQAPPRTLWLRLDDDGRAAVRALMEAWGDMTQRERNRLLRYLTDAAEESE